jgi:NAD+ kinase
VEKKVLEKPLVSNGNWTGEEILYFQDYNDIFNQTDFITCLGEEGTLLYVSSF